MDGLLLIDKPIRWTSFDVVNKVRSLLAKELDIPKRGLKVGHTGTLDPLATGLLVLTLGTYCKRANEFVKLDKSYECEITLGISSVTDDSEGELTAVSNKVPSRSDIQAALSSFLGEQSQKPPQYSAIKIAGQRAYKQARKGVKLQLEPRKIMVYSIDQIDYSFPLVRFELSVSSGTYVRSIARDLGDKLGTGAYLSQLRRTKVGEFKVSEAVRMDGLSASDIGKLLVRA